MNGTDLCGGSDSKITEVDVNQVLLLTCNSMWGGVYGRFAHWMVWRFGTLVDGLDISNCWWVPLLSRLFLLPRYGVVAV